jgi:dihydroorotate dehydrogenase
LVYRSLLRPILFSLPPETAHHLALKSLKLSKPIHSLVFPTITNDKSTRIDCFGLTFPNPIGLAAGFDKDGVALNELASLGFGHIEAGTVTYNAQPGNPRPRLFRLPKDQALINRAGFNNNGAAAFAKRINGHRPNCVLGVSIGKSKVTPLENAVDDYLASFNLVYEHADYVAINVSSPNTPQLRQLQQADHLSSLLSALQTRNKELQSQRNRTAPIPLLVKLSPDLLTTDLEMIVDVVQRLGIDGIIATNTTVSRESLHSSKEEVSACGDGGLSGRPLTNRSTRMIAELYKLTNGNIPIVGVGGVFTAEDAWDKIAAGASLVQLYTGFIYQGPTVAKEIVEGLRTILKEKGFTTVQGAVGHRLN